MGPELARQMCQCFRLICLYGKRVTVPTSPSHPRAVLVAVTLLGQGPNACSEQRTIPDPPGQRPHPSELFAELFMRQRRQTKHLSGLGA